MIRSDFVSNSSSSSFIVDAASDPHDKLPNHMSFETYCREWLNRDVFGWWDRPTVLSYKNPEFFINCIKENIEPYHAILKTDRKLGEELLEHIRRTDDSKIKWEDKKHDYAKIKEIEDTLIEHITDVLLPVFKDMDLHYVDAADDTYMEEGTNAEEFYEDQYRSIHNPKFSRHYNCH